MLGLIFTGVSCGVKAPPQPREVVVPGPVGDFTVELDPEGPRIVFTLPSVSIDGTPLKKIGGYRVLRKGPEGKQVREEVRFSVTEQTRMAGKQVSFQDAPPAGAGVHSYCVVPLDTYGSHPKQNAWVVIDWQGPPPEGNPEAASDHPR